MTLPTGGVALSMIASQERGSFYLVSVQYIIAYRSAGQRLIKSCKVPFKRVFLYLIFHSLLYTLIQQVHTTNIRVYAIR